MPITDESVYPSLSGNRDGYFFRLLPGLNGLPGALQRLSEPQEILSTTNELGLEWIAGDVGTKAMPLAP